jgi:hypothetical protein
MNDELNNTFESINEPRKNINNDDVISSHNIYPNMKAFERKDLDEWCAKHQKKKNENKIEEKATIE